MFQKNFLERRRKAIEYQKRMNDLENEVPPLRQLPVESDAILDVCLTHNSDAASVYAEENAKTLADLRIKPVRIERDAIRCTVIHGNKPAVLVALRALEGKNKPVVLDANYQIEGVKVYNSITTCVLNVEGDMVQIEYEPDIRMNTTYHLTLPNLRLVGDVTRDRATVQLNNLVALKNTLFPLPKQIANHEPGVLFDPPPIDFDLEKLGFKDSITSIWGPPGTGKTRMIVSMLKDWEGCGKLIVVTAPHNKGVAAISEQLDAADCPHWLFINPKKANLYPKSAHAKHTNHEMFGDELRAKLAGRNTMTRESIENFVSHSTIILMTVSRALSLTKTNVPLRPDVLLIDEAYVLPAYLFVALAALNYRALVISGDPNQHPPFVEIDIKNDIHNSTDPRKTSMALANFSVVFPLPDRCVIKLGDGNMRMPMHYTRLFGSLFYHQFHCYDNYFWDKKADYGVQVLRLGGEVKTVKNSNGQSVVYNIDSAIELSKGIGDVLVITPYIGQAAVYNHDSEVLMGTQIPKELTNKVKKVNASTLRASQGSQADIVKLDMVRRGGFLSFTNHSAVVAFSRHKSQLVLSNVPTFKKEWLGKLFVFDNNASIQRNYARFMDAIRPRNYYWGTAKIGWDHPLKWRFFCWVLEHIVATKTTNKPGKTFAKMATGVISNPTYSGMLSQAVNDYEIMNVLSLSIMKNSPVQLTPEIFRNPRNFQLYLDGLTNCLAIAPMIHISNDVYDGVEHYIMDIIPLNHSCFLKQDSLLTNVLGSVFGINVYAATVYATLHDLVDSLDLHRCSYSPDLVVNCGKIAPLFFPWALVRHRGLLLPSPG